MSEMDKNPRDEAPPAATSRLEKETPEALFERIRQRRSGGPAVAAAAARSAAAPGAERPAAAPAADRKAAAQPMRIDEILAGPGSQPGPTADVGAPGEAVAAPSAVADPAAGKIAPGPTAAPGPFPRSATMRLLLKHPELALGVGLPAAGLILGFPKSRRLLGAAIRLGTRPEVQQAMQLTSVLRQRGRRRSRSDPEAD